VAAAAAVESGAHKRRSLEGPRSRRCARVRGKRAGATRLVVVLSEELLTVRVLSKKREAEERVWERGS